MKSTSKIRSKKALDEKVWRLKELQSMISELEAEAESIKDEIKAYMGEEEIIETENHTVRWTKVNSNRFDQSLFKEIHPKLYSEFQSIVESRRFSIKDNSPAL